MATYIVGDLQGCYDELQLLLDKVRFDPAVDMLYLVGDLVARGDKSLQCLTLVKSLGTSAKTVLGNHDLHFIATVLGIKKIKARDRVEQIFQSDQLAPLTHWLRQQPLLIHRPDLDFVITHAGISPQWDLATAKACAAEVERELQQGDYYSLMSQMYGNQPDYWSPELQGMERLRYIINVFTRMRYCYADGRLDFDCKLPPAQAPTSLQPWFNLANPLYQQMNLLFGHWASLAGVATPPHIYALDTGCVWNNAMTMLRWEDKQYFVQPAIKDYRFTD